MFPPIIFSLILLFECVLLCLFVFLFVWEGALLGASVTPLEVWAGSLYEVPVSHSPGKEGINPLCSWDREAYPPGPRLQYPKWLAMEYHPPRARVQTNSQCCSYSNVIASSMAGMCEKAIMSSEFHCSVFLIGWLCSMSKRACWTVSYTHLTLPTIYSV